MFDNPELKNLSRYVRSYLGGLRTLCVEVDGQEWKYLEGGKGETILFLHGGLGSKTQWRSLMREYLTQYRVIAVDVPGLCVNQTFHAKKHSFRQLGIWLSKVIEQLRLGRVHLMGSSLGAAIAAYYAANHPDQVESLTLLGFPDQLFSKGSSAGEVIREIFDASCIQTTDDLQFYYQRVFYQLPTVPKIVLRYNLREFLKYRDVFRTVVAELVEAGPVLMASLRKIRMPTLVLHGECDQVFQSGGAEFWELQIPHAQFHLLAECGHMIHIEKPDEVVKFHRKLLRIARYSATASEQQEEETGRFSVLE